MTWKELVREIPDFPIPGVRFRDLLPVMANARCWQAMLSEFTELVRDFKVDVILAPEARAFLLAAPLSDRLCVGLVPIRKPGKLPPPILQQSFALEYGQAELSVEANISLFGKRALVVDDVLATGGTARAVMALGERLGADVVGCAFVIELTAMEGRRQLPTAVASLWPVPDA